MAVDQLTIPPFSLNAGATRDFDIDLEPLYSLPDGSYTVSVVESTTGQNITLNVTIAGDSVSLSVGSPIGITQSSDANGNVGTTTVTVTNNDTITHSGVLELRTWAINKAGAMDRDLLIEYSLDNGATYTPFSTNYVFSGERINVNEMLMQYNIDDYTDDQPISGETRVAFIPYAIASSGTRQILVRGTASFAVDTGSYGVKARLYEKAGVIQTTITNPMATPIAEVRTRQQRSPNGDWVQYQDNIVGVNVSFSAPPIGLLEIVGLVNGTETSVGTALVMTTKRGASKKARFRVKNVGSGTQANINLVVREPDANADKMITRIQQV